MTLVWYRTDFHQMHPPGNTKLALVACASVKTEGGKNFPPSSTPELQEVRHLISTTNSQSSLFVFMKRRFYVLASPGFPSFWE